MKCPYCDSEKTKVVDKRKTETNINRRRRECFDCRKRFTTYERVEGLSNVLSKIKKRDGQIADFDSEKITEAIFKAAKAVGGKDRKISENLTTKVIEILKYRFKDGSVPTVEDVQDVVEYVLIETGHAKTAKAYILYREKHRAIREFKSTMVDVNDTISEYLHQTDWRVKENSNEQYSFSGLLLHISGKVIANYALTKIYTPQIAEAYKKGYIHVHDLSHGFIGYSFYRNEAVVVRQKGENKMFCLGLEQLYDLVNAPVIVENGFEIKYTTDYEILDETGWTAVQRVLRHKLEKPLISFNTEQGNNLIVTDDHPFITLQEAKETILCSNCGFKSVIKNRTNKTGKDYYKCKTCKSRFGVPIKDNVDINKRKECLAKEVSIKDYIITPAVEIPKTVDTSALSAEDGWFIGLFAADGYFWKNYVVFEFSQNSPDVEKLLNYLGSNSINYNSFIRNDSLPYSNLNPQILETQLQGKISIAIHLNSFSLIMTSLISQIRPYSENKNLPIEFIGMNDAFVGGLISGVIDGDGCVRNDDPWVSRVNIRVTSKTLLSQIQFWLSNKKIKSSLTSIDSYGERHYQNKSIISKKQLYSLTFSIPEESKDLFSECIKINLDFKYSKGGSRSSKLKGFSSLRKIENIKNDSDYVYDITTSSRTFICNGVLAHNCAGWSLKNLLLWGFGGVKNKVDAKPAKHLSTVVHQMVNYIGCLQMEFAGAQAFSSVDTLLAPFVKADNLTYDEVKQAMQQLVYSLNIPSRWGCFSEDTEIMTLDGWRLGKELKERDIIATFNTNTEEIEYLPVLKMTKDFYKGKMYRLNNRIMDQLITPNHRVLRRIHNFREGLSKSKYVFEEAENLKTKIPLIPLGGRFEGLSLDEELVKSLAWITSEGSLCRNERICVHQSEEKNPGNCEEIREVLTGSGFGFDEQLKLSGYTGERNCLRFRLSRPASKELYAQFFPNYIKRIPEELRFLSTGLARKFIDTYMKGDGWVPENKIYTKSKENADIIQEMIAKAGWGSTCYLNKNKIYVIRVIKHDYTQTTSIEQVDYEGYVWCPTTKNNTVIVRRNGKVFISGNSQYPFSNLTFDWTVPEDMKEELGIVGGKEQEYTYGELQKEMDMINKAFIEVMLGGDAYGRIFSFPIPTYNLTKDFNWESENAKLLFEMTAKYGTPYFQNYIGSNLDPKSIRAMCCRLNLDLNEIINRPGHIFAAGDSTGSLGVVTLNMNRMAYESKTKEEFFEKVKYYMSVAKDSLEMKREVVDKNMETGLMPYTKRYLGTFKNHFSTIGLCGMNEACLNLIGKDISTKEGKQLTIETLEFMRQNVVSFQKETGNLYNLEATPAESTSYRFAKLDKEIYPEIITAGEKEPFLTNSTQLPVNFGDDVIAALEHQNDIQPLYTGGTIFHTFLGESMSSGESCKELVKKIAKNTRIPYFTITPTFSICPEHGYQKGEHHSCQKEGCEKECEVYSRIVGYFRPVKNWNIGKQEEFKVRQVFDEKKAFEKPLACVKNGATKAVV